VRPRNDESARFALRRRIAVGLALAAIVVVALVVVLWFSPLLSVRSVAVDGAVVVPEEQVLDALAVPDGTPLLRVDTAAAAQRVAAIPRVAQAKVTVDFPSTLRAVIAERVPVLFFESPRGAHLIDANAVEFAVAPPPPGLPVLHTLHPGTADRATRAAVAVLDSLPDSLRPQLASIAAKSESDIELTLHDGRVVIWGGDTGDQRKAAIIDPLLTRPGQTYDISSPDLPTVR
jgi:cell division protein FtsQ